MDEYQVNSIAIKTLKQRCEYLQSRLNAVEEENCKLKLEKAQYSNTTQSRGFDNLEERVITLIRERLEMARQIQMITKENSTLWEQLSKFLPESNISSLKFSVATNKQGINQYENTSKDYSKESLEEISLKLINGIILGKNELEKQYSEMIELQKESVADQSSSFTHKQIDNRITTKNLKDYVQKLKDFKQDLYKQKSDLSRAITSIKNLPVVSRQSSSANNRETLNFNHINSHKENLNQPASEFSTLQDPGRLGNGDQLLDSDKICPMCGVPFNGTFEDFTIHVGTHFVDEDENFIDAVERLD